MAEERKTPEYEPLPPPEGMEHTDYLFAELIRIADSIGLIAQGQLFPEQHTEPEKPRTGMMVLADGTDWNPGSGRGLYYYDEDSSSWIFIA